MWEDKLYVSAIEKQQALAETGHSSTQQWPQKDRQWDPKQRRELSTPQPCPRGCPSSTAAPSTAQKPSCLFFSLNSPIKMDQMNSPIFGVCSPHHERGQCEQSASWVPIPAPAGTWLGLSLERVTQNKDSGISQLNINVFFFFFPKKCLGHNSACLYKEDRQNCLEMEAKPDSPKLIGKFYNMNT